jgi:RNA polymerase sigma-54 factor
LERTDGVIDSLAERPTASERLLSEALLELPANDATIAEYLIGSLDNRGFLDTTIEQTASALGAEPERVRRVLDTLRDLGPPGLAAQDIRECLLLQLRALGGDSPAQGVAAAIISDHLNPLAKGHWSKIAASLGVSIAEVIAARDLIRERLSPYPALDSACRHVWEPPCNPPPLMPDVLIRLAKDAEPRLEAVVPASQWGLGVVPLYQTIADRSPGAHADRDAHHLVRVWVQRAAEFIQHVQRRTTTIERVVTHIANRQAEFVLEGPRRLRSLRRSQVAEDLGLHESTVSRAIADKTALLPSGRVVPLSDFFSASVPVEQALRELLQGETKRPSDRVLAVRLSALGFRVARRTVTKYRSHLEPVLSAR